MAKKTKVEKAPMSRVIYDSRDAGRDKLIPTSEAKRLFDEGKLAIDLTNSRSHERVYTLPFNAK